MSSLLGPPPTPLSSRLPMMSFVKASNPPPMQGSASSMSGGGRGGSFGENAKPSGSAGAMGFVSGGTLMPNSKPMLGSGNSMGFVSGGTLASSKPGFGGSANAMGFVSGGTLMPNSRPMLGGSASAMGFVSGGTMTPNNKATFGGSANAMGFVSGGTMAPNSTGSTNAMGFVSGGTMAPNSTGSTNAMGFVSGGTLTPNRPSFGGSSTGFSGSSNTSMYGGGNTVGSGYGGGQSLLGTPSTSLFGSAGTSNSLLPLPTATTTGTTTTTLITAPPAPKKKKSKDKDKNKPITEKFVKFIGGMSEDATTPENMDKMANTVPLQSYSAKAGEKAQGFMQGQSFSAIGAGNMSQPGQSQQQQQPTTAATPQHNHLANWCKVVGRDNPLAGFVVVKHENHDNGGAAAAILNTSSCFSRMPVNYHYQKLDHLHECTVNINGVDVVTSRASGRKKAREQAVVDAVAELPKHCFTLKIKKNIRAESVTLEQLGEDLANRNSMMDNPNSVASKMMKQMGWTGGGLGKKGEGITEPIRPSEVFGRQGLGHTGNKGAVTPAFRKRVREIVSDYASASKNVALAFSNDFSKEQRAEIHKIARLCHLKSATRGKDSKTRCLVITRKMPAQDLLLRLLQEGSNDQYELLPPSSATSSSSSSSYDPSYGSSSYGSTYGSYSSSYGSSSTSAC